MKTPFWRRAPDEALQIRGIDERHYLSQQVFFRREERGFTQAQLAEAARMTQSQVANIEAGQANPTHETLVKLAFALGCLICELTTPDQPRDGRGPEVLSPSSNWWGQSPKPS